MTLDLFGPQPAWRTIMMDPPWPEHGGGNRGADVHYDIANVDSILATIRGARTESGAPLFQPDTINGCHLFMWATETFDEAAIWLMRALGFRKVAGWVWVKGEIRDGKLRLQRGLGQYSGMCHERLLIGTVGPAGPPPPELRELSVELVPRPTRPGSKRPWHSRKPEIFYERAEKIGAGPRLEMFARVPRRPGWTAWGNESRALRAGVSAS